MRHEIAGRFIVKATTLEDAEKRLSETLDGVVVNNRDHLVDFKLNQVVEQPVNHELVRFMMKTDFDLLRREFATSVDKLSNFKRATAWEYVKALETRIDLTQKLLDRMGE